MQLDPAISAALALSLSALFAASVAHKASAFGKFVGVVRNYGIVPENLALAVAFAAVAAEAIVAAGLVLPLSRAAAALGAAGMLATYGAAIAFNIARGRRDIDCGCNFGESREQLSPALVARNAALAIAALVATAPIGERELGIFDFAFIGLFALASAALYIAFESLRSNAMRIKAAGHAI